MLGNFSQVRQQAKDIYAGQMPRMQRHNAPAAACRANWTASRRACSALGAAPGATWPADRATGTLASALPPGAMVPSGTAVAPGARPKAFLLNWIMKPSTGACSRACTLARPTGSPALLRPLIAYDRTAGCDVGTQSARLGTERRRAYCRPKVLCAAMPWAVYPYIKPTSVPLCADIL